MAEPGYTSVLDTITDTSAIEMALEIKSIALDPVEIPKLPLSGAIHYTCPHCGEECKTVYNETVLCLGSLYKGVKNTDRKVPYFISDEREEQEYMDGKSSDYVDKFLCPICLTEFLNESGDRFKNDAEFIQYMVEKEWIL